MLTLDTVDHAFLQNYQRLQEELPRGRRQRHHAGIRRRSSGARGGGSEHRAFGPGHRERAHFLATRTHLWICDSRQLKHMCCHLFFLVSTVSEFLGSAAFEESYHIPPSVVQLLQFQISGSSRVYRECCSSRLQLRQTFKKHNSLRHRLHQYIHGRLESHPSATSQVHMHSHWPSGRNAPPPRGRQERSTKGCLAACCCRPPIALLG